MTHESPDSVDLGVPDGRVLAHIGPHKTGTTSLQAALFLGRPAMRAQGVHHAGRGRNPARAVQAVTGQAAAYTDEPPPMREWERLAREIGRARARRVILSSEFLAHAQPGVIRRVVDDLGRDRVHVVTTLRPLARLIPSMWKQNVRAGRRVAFDTWLHRLFPPPGVRAADGFWVLHRHDELIARWAAEVGIDRVTAVVVDETDREMVLRAFERLLRLRSGTLRPVPGLANHSISAEEAEAIRAFNIEHHRLGLSKATHARAMRYGAAEHVAHLAALPGGTGIPLPAWALEPVAEAARGIVDGIRASGVRVVGDLERLAWVPDEALPDGEGLPDPVPPEVAARVAMGIVVASGLARADGAVPETQLATILPTVPTRHLGAAVAARTRSSVEHRRRRLVRALRGASGHGAPGEAGEGGAGPSPRGPATGGDPERRVSAPAILPERSIVVHIGPPKTGTTAIQASFHAARDEAERQGVHYAGKRRHSISAVQASIGRRGIRRETVPPVGAWHRLRDEILRSAAPRVVLSSEFFADAAPEKIREVVDQLGRDRVQVVLTLRPLARILPSQWQQYVQSGMSAAYGPWLHAMLNQPDTKLSPSFWHRHRADALIRRWAEAVGVDRVTAVVVDESDREMILRAFERLVGLHPGTLALQDELANRSLTMQEIEAVRALNVAFGKAGLGRTLHGDIVNFGATEYLKTLSQAPGTTRAELPAWAVPRVETIAREIHDGIAASGVRVIGDLERLLAVQPGVGPGPEGEGVLVPVAVAARLAIGVLFATGLADPPGGRRTGSLAPSAPTARMAEPIEIARVPTGRLVRELGTRARGSVLRRRGFAGSRP